MAWYQQTLVAVPERPFKEQVQRTEARQMKDIPQGRSTKLAIRSYGGAKFMASLPGNTRLLNAARIGGRIGLRVIPVVGAALLVYDLYQIGKWITED